MVAGESVMDMGDVQMMKYAIAAAALLAATGAQADTKKFSYSLTGTDVATGTFSYASGATGVLGYADLTSFTVSVSGSNYNLADIAGLTDYVHFGYDTATNTFSVDPNACGFAGCGFQSSLSAINSAGNFGFFFNGAPGAYQEYQTGTVGTFDTITISAGGVPEPAMWGLMIVGFGAIGTSLRRREVKVTYAA